MINVPYRITSVFGPDAFGGNGVDEVQFHCPKCIERKGTPDRKGKLYVNVKSYKFICFRCGFKGRISKTGSIDTSKYYENDLEIENQKLSHEIYEAIEGGDKFKLKIPVSKVTESESATSYLLKRGFSYDQMEYYDMRVGNLNQEFGRIIIPNEVKNLVYTDTYSARSFIDQTPKYHNPCGIKKSEVVFNLHRIREGDTIIVVEGVLTAVAAGKHAVSTLGKTMSRSQASQILSKNPKRIYLNYDYGAEKESHDACELLRSINDSIDIYEVFMKDERDAADLSTEEYVKCLYSAVKYEPVIKELEEIIYA